MYSPTRLLREPLVHFLVIGGLLFALYAAVSGPGSCAEKQDCR